MPEGEPTQNNQIEYVLTGDPKGYWGARARAAGLPPTSGNKTRRSSSRRSRGRRENSRHREVPREAKELRVPWTPNIIPNAFATQLIEKKLHYSRKSTNKYNEHTIDELQAMPRPQRKDIESKMSLDTHIKYMSNSNDYKFWGYPYKALVILAWPYFIDIISGMFSNINNKKVREYIKDQQKKIFLFMEIIYLNLLKNKSKEKIGDITLEEYGQKSEEERDDYLNSFPNGKSSEHAFGLVFGDFKGRTLNEIVDDLLRGDKTTKDDRNNRYIDFLTSFPPKERRELSFLVNLHILYGQMRGRPLPGYGDGRWTPP